MWIKTVFTQLPSNTPFNVYLGLPPPLSVPPPFSVFNGHTRPVILNQSQANVPTYLFKTPDLCTQALLTLTYSHAHIHKKKKKQTSAPQLNGNVGITVDMWQIPLSCRWIMSLWINHARYNSNEESWGVEKFVFMQMQLRGVQWASLSRHHSIWGEFKRYKTWWFYQ